MSENSEIYRINQQRRPHPLTVMRLLAQPDPPVMLGCQVLRDLYDLAKAQQEAIACHVEDLPVRRQLAERMASLAAVTIDMAVDPSPQGTTKDVGSHEQ